MILADIMSDINMVLTVFCVFFGLVIGLAILALRFVGRSMRDDWRKQGGAKGWARKSAPKAAGKLLRWLIFRRW